VPSTSSGGLRIPLDSDPIDDVAKWVRDLADDIDTRVVKKQRSGATSASTDASGDLTITHGLGTTPTTVLPVAQTNAGAWLCTVHTFTSTTFKVRFRVSNTGAVIASTPVAMHWLAIA